MKLHIITISLVTSILLVGCGDTTDDTETGGDTTSTLDTSGSSSYTGTVSSSGDNPLFCNNIIFTFNYGGLYYFV